MGRRGSAPGSTSRIVELLLQGLSKHSFVIVDAPTAIGATESAVLAGRTDFTLLVVDGQRGSRATAAEAVSALNGVGGNLIGCVTNTPRSRRFKRKTVPASFERPSRQGEASTASDPVAASEHVGH